MSSINQYNVIFIVFTLLLEYISQISVSILWFRNKSLGKIISLIRKHELRRQAVTT